MNHMLNLCLLPLGASQRRITHRASQLFRGFPRKIAYLGDRELDLENIGITLHSLDWLDHDFSLEGFTGFLLDLARPDEFWEFVHSQHGSELTEALHNGAPCLAIGGAAEIFGCNLLNQAATPVLHIIGDEDDLFAIDAIHRERREILVWQKKYPITVCIMDPDSEWRIENGRQFTNGVRRIIPGDS